MPGPARDTYTQTGHYVSRRIRFDTQGIAQGVELPFAMPEGAVHTRTLVNVVQTFTGSALTLQVGNAAQADAYATSAQIAPNVAGLKAINGSGRVLADTTPVVRLTVTNPTQGEADVILEYLPRVS